MSDASNNSLSCGESTSSVPLALFSISDMTMIISIVSFFTALLFATSWSWEIRSFLPKLASVLVVFEIICMVLLHDWLTISNKHATASVVVTMLEWTADTAWRLIVTIFIYLRITDLSTHFESSITTAVIRVVGWCVMAYHLALFCFYILSLFSSFYHTAIIPSTYAHIAGNMHMFGNTISGLLELYAAFEIWKNRHYMARDNIYDLKHYDIARTTLCLVISPLLSLYSGVIYALGFDAGLNRYFCLTMARMILLSIFNSSKTCLLLDTYTSELQAAQLKKHTSSGLEFHKGSMAWGAASDMCGVEPAKPTSVHSASMHKSSFYAPVKRPSQVASDLISPPKSAAKKPEFRACSVVGILPSMDTASLEYPASRQESAREMSATLESFYGKTVMSSSFEDEES
ncbi:hypothetical protein BATDEDRAFT_91842 [Batrachochytrium dendrobatidis JAM81]|uniref:Transmembrane protein n=2 Tax=Batrachochytrium dendrobatidis TaxID=109871 RepID=F4PBL5_BATDJ|nr:uncharacterized protein BATDEDRAFT_91842 [Batrachochytrium dendrobatidis JAM81]EGF77345.1 hypothetical protein BATDEDRAFT_91842 [Batrachochytrium dendrobatidis JAM81]|eukprot:XP_006682047.1 hypothetical protein BATDEDRAFT_91842 [Batrachochytrium dendrobatidis JAM81]